MEELTMELKAVLSSLIRGTAIKGPAEINLLMAENEEPVRSTAVLNAHIVEIIGELTLAKINLVSTRRGFK